MREAPFGAPAIAVSDRSTRENRTGSWKYIRPMYRDAVAPCNRSCPAGVDVEGYMDLLRQGRVDDALDLLVRENPMPAITGRVCHHPCETDCSRRRLDGAVSVHAVERALGDALLDRPPAPTPERRRRERVAVVGAGPAGLGAAYHLARMGYGVVVYDEAEEPGGMLRQGIPAYRLPRGVLDRQIDRIRATGVEIRTGVRLEGEAALDALGSYDAVLFALGAHRGRATGAVGEDGAGVIPGLAFLKAVNRGERPEIGRRVAVIGGGNTAMDCARTALRLGAHPIVVYRRTRAEMPAIPQEVEEAIAEGVDLMFLAAPKRYLRKAGELVGLELTRMELGPPDASGRRRPVPVAGEDFVLPVETVLTAIGEDPELDALPHDLRERHPFKVDALGATGITTFFASGDMAGAERTVADALGSGKRAAIGIDRYLRWVAGERVPWGEVSELRWADGSVSISRWRGDDPVRRIDPTNEVVDIESLQLAHFPPAERHPDRWSHDLAGFTEVNLGLDLEDAVAEARRCFNCGVCNDCELCLILCPDVAIRRKPEGGFEIDMDHCKGCGLCAEECPRGAIVMTREGL